MDYENFDNDNDDSDENYFAFVRWLEDLTAIDLRQAKGDIEAQKKACCRYYKRGYKANLTTAELIDFLGVSHDSILDKAGYSDEESTALFVISDALTEQDIANADLDS
jgi:hypothetical protein